MLIDHKSLQYDLRNFFLEEFVYDSTNLNKDILKKLADQIKNTLQAELSAVYLYNDSIEDYELASENAGYLNIKPDLFASQVLNKQDHNTKISDVINVEAIDICKATSTLSFYLISLNKEKPRGFILLAFSNHVDVVRFKQQFTVIAEEVYNFLNGFNSFIRTKEKANKYEFLYHVTAKLYSSINTKDILSEVIDALSEIYPRFNFNFFLSHDYQEDWMLPINQLKYKEFAHESSVQAFLTGNVQVEKNKNKSRINAPLKGQQGIYGVLQITTPFAYLFTESDIKFITLLTNTAGNAVENAILFQQSRQLSNDLQLINETSHKLNSNLRLNEITLLLKKQIKESFGAEEICFILFNEDQHEIVEGSTNYFKSKVSTTFLNFIVPKLKIDKKPHFISDFTLKYPELENFNYHSVMAIPMIQLGQIKGAIIVLHQVPYHFSFESFKLIQSLVHHSSLAFVNTILREQLENMVITDYLTKLYSRKYLDERLQEHLQKDQQGVFILIDIDDFKRINDIYGHDMGDNLLIQVSNIITINLGDSDFAARWGGEELAIYLPQVSVNQGMELAKGLVRQVATYTKPVVTISIGVSYWSQGHPLPAKKLFDRADQAMYEAKRNGKNCVVQAR